MLSYDGASGKLADERSPSSFQAAAILALQIQHNACPIALSTDLQASMTCTILQNHARSLQPLIYLVLSACKTEGSLSVIQGEQCNGPVVWTIDIQ